MSVSPVPAACAKSLPSLELDERSLVFLKWLALALMLVDHFNKYLLGGSSHWMYAAGRVSMPLFAFVLGYNLGRPGSLAVGVYRRVAGRLLVFGALATPVFGVINKLPGGWYPLNMMFALLVAVLGMWMIDRGGRWIIGACLLTAWGGAFVEFWWPAMGLCLAVWAYRRRPSYASMFGFALCLALLYLINRNLWAMAAVPVIALASRWTATLPRAKWLFYWFYPAHLWLFWVYLTWARG